MTDYITCHACHTRIREFESDICLRRRDGSEMRFYLSRCSHVPAGIVGSSANGKECTMTQRSVLYEGGAV